MDYMTFIAVGLIVFGLLWVLLCAPRSNQIVQLDDVNEILEIQSYLNSEGIKTYTKNTGLLPRKGGFGGDPSLHAIRAEDCNRAIELTKSFLNSADE